MWLTRYKIRLCVLTFLLLCLIVIGLALVFPYIATMFCTDISHASYSAKSYNYFWETSAKSSESPPKEIWKKQFHPRSPSDIDYAMSNISKLLEPSMAKLETLRKDIFLKALSDFSWTKRKVRIVAASQEEYFNKLENFPNVHTIKLTTSLPNLRHSLRSQVYNETSNDCDLYTNKAQHRNDVYGITRKCAHNPQHNWNGQAVTFDVLKPGSPKGYVHSSSDILLTYLHVIEGAIASQYGDVYTNGLRIIPIRCQLSEIAQQDIKLTKDQKLYFSEVFTLSTVWGEGFYHWFVESLPRIVPYIEFLRKNPNIRIHVTEVNRFVRDTLRTLGLQENELVSGHVYADLMYMPAGVTCGTPSWFSIQLQSLLFRKTMAWPPEPRQSIILIKRSAKRYFYCHDYIWNMLKRYGVQYNLRVELFPDDPLPDMETTMKIFNRALMIVAPHGAGLSNIIYSEPNTVVMEGLKCGADNFATLCYSDLSYALGHHYVGLLYEHKQCNWIEAANIEPAVKYYLKTIFE